MRADGRGKTGCVRTTKGINYFLYLCERKKGMEKTGELNILENLERKMGALGSCGCLMSLNLMSLSLNRCYSKKNRSP